MRKRTWPGCEAPTELYVLEGAGHVWPGAAIPLTPGTDTGSAEGIDATEIFFDFVFADSP